MQPIATYLAQIQLTRATKANTPETSFYPALKGLLDAVGSRLSPKVVCVMNLRNAGAGLPDGGLFGVDQLGVTDFSTDRGTNEALHSIPSRGAIEVKGLSKTLAVLAASEQVTRYGNRYRHVLITNLREFWLIEHHGATNRVRERYSLATSESKFWQLVSDPDAIAVQEPLLLEFLERVLRTPAPIGAPEDVAWFLASYARDALMAVEEAPTGVMEDISDALSNALGVGFGDAKGRHFFHSTLVQTLFYGVFSAWVLWGQQPRTQSENFRWRETTDLLHLPILKVLFHEMTRPTLLFTNALRERLDLAESTLNRVDREIFYKRFPQHEAVQYFYEPFLEAFDAELRRQLGVWYTPDEIVRYMVERVDRSLRDELGLTAGLADPNVVILDPACGTGGFLLAVLERIAKTLEEQGSGTTAAARLVEAVTSRLHGFEILPAPFVIAHLQIALYLRRLGVSLPEGKRVGIYLTNALTGWGRAVGRQAKLPAEFAAERAAANDVKQRAPVIVVLGNPPYSAFAGVQPKEEQESVDVYKEGLIKKWKVRKFNLDELFVRFFRLAERKIAEQSGRGVVCYISSASYVSDPSFVVMRERFLREFDTITIDNLNGDSRETGKIAPDGTSDPSVFSTERNREGIRLGTAVGLFVLRAPRTAAAKRAKTVARVRWRDFWGVTKRQALLDSLSRPDGYTDVSVSAAGQWSFLPRVTVKAYTDWSAVTDLCRQEPISGLAEKRRTSLIAMDKATLADRFRAYFDPGRTWDDVRAEIAGLAFDAACYPAKATREKILKQGQKFVEANIRRYAFLPLDNRFCYHADLAPLWNRSRPTLSLQATGGNKFLVLRRKARQADEGIPAFMAGALPDHHLLDPNAVAIPLRWSDIDGPRGKFQSNLSQFARDYLTQLGIVDFDDEYNSTLLWFHCLAIMHSPRYLADNGDGVRGAVPRIPLPGERDVLERSASLGREIAKLLDPDLQVEGVTAGRIAPEFRPLGALQKVGNAPIDPASGDLSLTKRWGALQRGTIVMPGPGYRTAGLALVDQGSGTKTWNIWLNDSVYWSDVPEAVWEFSIGSYQVIKKWLSYRDRSVLNRDLTLDEAEHVVAMVRRIAAVLSLSEKLDAVYTEAANNLCANSMNLRA